MDPSRTWRFDTDAVRDGGRGGGRFSALGLNIGDTGASSGSIGASNTTELRSVPRLRGGGGAGGLPGVDEDDAVLSCAPIVCSSAIGADLPEGLLAYLERSWLCRRARGGAGAARGRLVGSSYGPELKSLGDDNVAEGTTAESGDAGTGGGGRGLFKSVEELGERVGDCRVGLAGLCIGSSAGGSELDKSDAFNEPDRPSLPLLARGGRGAPMSYKDADLPIDFCISSTDGELS